MLAKGVSIFRVLFFISSFYSSSNLQTITIVPMTDTANSIVTNIQRKIKKPAMSSTAVQHLIPPMIPAPKIIIDEIILAMMFSLVIHAYGIDMILCAITCKPITRSKPKKQMTKIQNELILFSKNNGAKHM